jgi:hypothetical protein
MVWCVVSGVWCVMPYCSEKISEPMDLGTIAKRVEIGFYGDDHQDFARVSLDCTCHALMPCSVISYNINDGGDVVNSTCGW